MPAFPEINRIRFEGPKSKNPLAFRYYDENEVVAGRTMKDHLRFSVVYWHTFRGVGSDPFGPGTAVRPWDDGSNSVENAEKRARVAFEFIEKLGALCTWYVNALTDWPCAKTYAKMVEEVEAMDRETFRRRRAELIQRDRELSEELIKLEVPHYSIRYAHVMGVRSDYVAWERRQQKSTREEQAVVYTLD